MNENTEKQKLEDFAHNFWKFGNTIAGFAAIQIMAVIAAVATSRVGSDKFIALFWTFIGSLIASPIVFGVAIWACYKWERKLREASCQPDLVLEISHKVMLGRIIVIVAFSIFGIFILAMKKSFYY